MSISRLQGAVTTSVAEIITWLNANKTGTFLENATIESDSPMDNTNGYGNSLKITLDDAVFKMGFPGNNSRDASTFCKYTVSGTDKIALTFTPPSGGFSGFWLKQGDCVMCKNAVVFGFQCGKDSTQYGYQHSYVAIFAGNDGELCMIGSNAAATTTAINISYDFKFASPASEVTTVTVKPSYNAYATTIAELSTIENGEFLVSPCAYLAIRVQYTAGTDDPSAVYLGGKIYATNGKWYFKDE